MRSQLLALTVCCISPAVMATADGPDHYRVSGVAAGGYLNLRAEPGTQAAVIGWIPAGMTCLRNLGCQGGLSFEEFTTLSDQEKQRRLRTNPRWCKVDYRGVVGWVKGSFLAEAACHTTSADQRVIIVDFPRDKDAVTLEGRVRGREFIDYRFRAAAGRTLTAKLKTSHSVNYFNILPPGSSDVALYRGHTSGDHFEGIMPTDGEYTVRVYLMRSAARRNESSRYTLDLALTGTALPPLAGEQDARLPGTPYHASSTIGCTLPYEPETKTCEAFVIRRGFDGTATLEIRGAKSYLRRILFIGGDPVAADSAQPLRFSREGDRIRVEFHDHERVEVPEALITGG